MTDFAFIFPGQGSQFIGMGKSLAEAYPSAAQVFEEVDDALSEPLSKLIWEGEEAALTLTANAQPALMAVSVASARVLEAEMGLSAEKAHFVAGHSLGEYSALAVAGAMSVADTAQLLRIRGEAMQAAVAPGFGAMAALLGATQAQAEAACGASPGICEIANDNAPGQIVLSGTAEAVDAACAWAKENGVKKAMPLSVSAPFHCSLMAPAAAKMEIALGEVDIAQPVCPLIANTTAAALTNPNDIRNGLVEQVTAQVRWRESVQFMHEQGVTTLIELGAGKVLSVMNRRNVKEMRGLNFGSPDDLPALREALGL